MTFNGIFKSSFLENIASVSILDMVIALTLAFGIGMFIFLVYKKHIKALCILRVLEQPLLRSL
jgi:hypothetical protein